MGLQHLFPLPFADFSVRNITLNPKPKIGEHEGSMIGISGLEFLGLPWGSK